MNLATQRRRRVEGFLLRIQVVSGPNLWPDSVYLDQGV